MNIPPTYRFKVAFTFSSLQGNYVAALAKLLVKKFGADAIYDYRNLQARLARPRADVTMEADYLRESLLVVVCHSREYRQSQWTAGELQAAYALGMEDSGRVFLMDMDGSEKLHPYRRSDIFYDARSNSPEQAFIEICKRLDDLTDRKLPAARRPNNLPFPSLGSLLKGRERVLEQLHKQRQTNPAMALVQVPAIQGEGGIGKTRLAIEYAWHYEAEYTALLFVQADSPQSLRRNMAKLCDADILNLPEWDKAKEHEQAAAALRWLQEHSGWLLILDNCSAPLKLDHETRFVMA